MALNNLIDAYEKLLPRKRYKMKNKKSELTVKWERCLDPFQGNLK